MPLSLAEFYTDCLAWIEAGQPVDDVFGNYGLCLAVIEWAECKGCPEYAHTLQTSMKLQFHRAGLALPCPFEHNFFAYLNSQAAKSLYQNPQRLAWIKHHASR